jgi:hypothetical protein
MIHYIKNNLSFFLSGKGFLFNGHSPVNKGNIPPDFLGICVAGSPEEGYNDYLLEQLKDLGVTQVRLDYTYSDQETSFNAELLNLLFINGYKVMLHLVQPPDDAALNTEDEATEKWKTFVSEVLKEYHSKIECIEVGSTLNRKKWTKYKSLKTFTSSWLFAYGEAKKYDLLVAGPNFTDFEPVFNIALLPELKKLNALPDIHTNNMFAERAVEPELFDHKVLGDKFRWVHKFNLIKKAKFYQKISAAFGISKTMSPHVAWSLRRIDRVLADKEEKHADYVARYCALLASSGSFDRMYWGPLVSQREGFIDDGTEFYPSLFHVTLYSKANGKLKDYRKRPAFDAYRTVQKFIAGSKYLSSPASSKGLEIHRFEKDGQEFHMLWTTNGNIASLSSIYSSEISVKAYDVCGNKLSQIPAYIFEKPVYLFFDKESPIKMVQTPKLIPKVRFKPFSYNEFVELIVNSDRKVMYKKEYEELVLKFINSDKTPYENTVYITDSKEALRCWNNLHEFRRRGLSTEEPIALVPHEGKYSLIIRQPDGLTKASTADMIIAVDALNARKGTCHDNGCKILVTAESKPFFSCLGTYSFADR